MANLTADYALGLLGRYFELQLLGPHGSVGYPVVHLFVDDLFVYVALLFFIRIIVIWQL